MKSFWQEKEGRKEKGERILFWFFVQNTLNVPLADFPDTHFQLFSLEEDDESCLVR